MYTLDANAAKQADNINSRITENGKYIGIFTRAEHRVSKEGTQGIEFTFQAENGQSADFLQIWTLKNNGERISGFQMLMAIMTCLQLRQLDAPIKQIVEKWVDGKKDKHSAEVFPALMNKRIGLILQKEHYNKTNGSPADRMLIYMPFNEKGFTASEILEKANKPEKMDRALVTLKDRYAKGYVAHRGEDTMPGANKFGAPPEMPPGYMDGFDQDIPF